jgi:hypothetical protein
MEGKHTSGTKGFAETLRPNRINLGVNILYLFKKGDFF